jgi:hypothetical protein
LTRLESVNWTPFALRPKKRIALTPTFGHAHTTSRIALRNSGLLASVKRRWDRLGSAEFGAKALSRDGACGTVVTIIVVLLILLVIPKAGAFVRRCPVCDHVVLSRGRYCGECGSKV